MRENKERPPREAGCPYCKGEPLKLKHHHPFVVRHLLHKSVPPEDPEGKRASSVFKLKQVNWEHGVALYEMILETGNQLIYSPYINRKDTPNTSAHGRLRISNCGRSIL